MASPFRGVDSQHVYEKEKETPTGSLFLFLVEPRGIEPLSENHLIQLSPSAADLLRFPSRIAGRQAMRYGSHYAVTVRVAPRRSRSPLIDAPHPAAVLRGRTGGLIKPPRQRYCCRLLFKFGHFDAIIRRATLIMPQDPCRSHCGPIGYNIVYPIFEKMSKINDKGESISQGKWVRL